MKTQIRFVLILAGLLLSASVAAASVQPAISSAETQTTETLLLNGNDWRLGSFAMDEGVKSGAFLPSFDDSRFHAVKVPGEVQLQVGLSGMDLYRQSKTLSLINRKEWWYRKHFKVGKQESGKLNRLMFDGVDYFATVWLNGKKLGEHEGGYVPFSYDVTNALHYGGDNVLVVKVTCPWYPKGRGLLEYMKGNWTAVNAGDQLHIDKPPYFFGAFWDGTPNDGNATLPMGLTRNVRLVSSDFSVVEDAFVSTESLNPDGSATLAISGTIGNHRDHDVSAELKLNIRPENFSGEAIPLPSRTLTLHPGENHFSLEATVKQPHLWWSWDMGKPNLYRLTASISPGRENSRSVVFGIRTIKVKSDMSYWLNGRRIFLKGAWYPMSDYYGSKPTRDTFLKDLELAKAANLNSMVAFTVVEKPAFYNLCDRLGILLIVELPFEQSGPIDVLSPANPRRPIYVKESLGQVQQILMELRNHPSIVEWAAFAETQKNGKWGIGDWDFSQYGYGPFADKIGKLVEQFDPGTIYHPSLCDFGEQHFWQGAAGSDVVGSYLDHFHAQAGFISEYGSVSLPVLDDFKKEIAPSEMWSKKNAALPEWYNLPIDVSAYAYLSSYTYDGLASQLARIDEYVDRRVESIRDLVNDSQLYQSFLFKYATESYRRKKYSPINGIRFWDFGEVWPGIRWGVIDYYRVPKMGYYFLKRADSRFLLSFANQYELESRPSGSPLRFPVWIVNDHPSDETATVHCQIQDLSGHVLWQTDFAGVVPADGKKEMGIVQWTAPDAPGVYVLTGRASTKEDGLQTSNSTFIKVTPKLFSRPLRVLLIGQSKYSLPIAKMIRAAGANVDVMDENSLARFNELSDGSALRKKYDVIWLAAFDSIWRLLTPSEVEGLKTAISNGTGFIHTGGRGSFHGGFGEGAALDLVGLDDVLPIQIKHRYDLVLGQPEVWDPVPSQFTPIKDVRVLKDASNAWSDSGWKNIGLPGFNDTALKPGAREILSIDNRPLLATGRYGQGRTVAFTGFTPALGTGGQNWDDTHWVVDHEMYKHPIDKVYFLTFMQLLAAASGEKPQTSYATILAAHVKPLFETLKEQPPATVQTPKSVEGKISQGRGRFSVQLTNGTRYARLVRVRATWAGEPADSPYLVLYNDNYFDLLPGETKTIRGDLLLPDAGIHSISGMLTVAGVNVPPTEIPITLQ